MKKLVFALVSGLFFALTLTACNEEIQGALHVKKGFVVHGYTPGYEPYPSSNVDLNVSLEPGDYGTSFYFKNKTELQMSFKGKPAVTIEVPKDSQFPEENGVIAIDGKKMKQDFGMYGKVATVHQNSSLIKENQRCSYIDIETFCDTDYHGHTYCGTRQITRFGYQHVEFYIHESQTKTQIKFVSVNGEDTLADFSSAKYFSERIYSYYGDCH